MEKNCVIKDGYAILDGRFYFEAESFYYASEEVRIFMAAILSLYKENADKKFFFEFELRQFFDVVKNVLPQTSKTFYQLFDELKMVNFLKCRYYSERTPQHNKWYLDNSFYGKYNLSDRVFSVAALSEEIGKMKDVFFASYSKNDISAEWEDNDMNFKSIRWEAEKKERLSYDLSEVF